MGRKFCVKPIFLGCHGQERDEQEIYIRAAKFVKSCKEHPLRSALTSTIQELTV